MDSNYPIDIHIHKLLDWLISRKICDSGWINDIKTVREKIRHALEDMPEHKDIVQLLSGSYLHYFYAVQIVNILKQTEADSKNIFGMYGSNRMKDWQEIIKLYEKKSLYLAESSDILLKNIKYEIPNYKKHLNKLENTKSDYKKRIEEYEKSIVSTNKDIATLKKQLAIKGDHIQQELKDSVSSLPGKYAEITNQIKDLVNSVNYYIEYSNYVLASPLELPLLQHLISKGNSTAFEFKYKRAPSSIEEFVFHIEDPDQDSTQDVIDWGDDAIDWGGDSNKDGEEFEIVLESETKLEEGPNSDVAKGPDALSILDSPELRNLLLDELYEIQSFYKINIAENHNSDSTSISIVKRESYDQSLDKISRTLAALCDTQLVYLQNIKHSPSYLEKILTLYNEKFDALEKSRLSIEVLGEKIIATDADIEAFLPKLKTLVANTQELKQYLCDDISKRYNGRSVELIGKIE
uniref:CDK5 regulatory subunit-associated protein 3 n=1 Tax=Cacopsylla melanoneura TaxID=428564 RepID=A0A8D8RYE3_9HEMI